MRKIENINIVLENEVIYGDVLINDGLIEKIDIKDKFQEGKDILIPGFIDVHIHGGYSYDVMDAGDATKNLALNLPKEGTTSFLPTTMTQSFENIYNALEATGKYYLNQDLKAARVLGVHLEGPYVNVKAAGAQPIEFIKEPDLEEFKKWNEASGNIIKKVSLAPENDQDFKFIKYLKENNISASIAHTVATYKTAAMSIEAGVDSFTHTYNAMTKLHHRDVGVVGAAYLHKDVYSELIFDKIHTSLEAGQILLNNKTHTHLILITDSMRNKGLADGVSELGGQTVYVKGNEARLADGALAGSILKMIDGYKNLVNDLNLPLHEASHVASLTPAKSLHIDNILGSIKVGKYADLVLLDKDLNIKKTIINGSVVYKK